MSTRLSTSQRRSTAAMVEAKRGWLYAIPDWLFIIVLFFVPIVLLVVMACSRWGLMGRKSRHQLPGQLYQSVLASVAGACSAVHVRVHSACHCFLTGAWTWLSVDRAGEH